MLIGAEVWYSTDDKVTKGEKDNHGVGDKTKKLTCSECVNVLTIA